MIEEKVPRLRERVARARIGAALPLLSPLLTFSLNRSSRLI
jgi:hypothetical protein